MNFSGGELMVTWFVKAVRKAILRKKHPYFV